MKYEESDIEQIILAHAALVSAYVNVLTGLNGEGFFIVAQYKSNSIFNFIHLIWRKGISNFDKMLLVFQFLISLFIFPVPAIYDHLFNLYLSERRHTSKQGDIWIRLGITVQYYVIYRPVIRSFVKYLVKIHLQRQYYAIYQLYLSKILTQNTTRENDENINRLRDIAADLKDYLDTLPNSKNIFASLLVVFSIVSAVIGLLKLGDLIIPFITTLPFYMIIGMIIGIIIIGYSVTIPFLYAFKYKRRLFLRTDLQHDLSDIYLGNEQALCNNSIYRVENDLFGALGSRNQKLNELPFDEIFTIFTGVLIISFFIYLGLFAVCEQYLQPRGLCTMHNLL